MAVLPENVYLKHDVIKGNGQSRLLQAVRQAIISSYPRSEVRADGQVVKINFSDGMKFEILPAFKNTDWYGSWMVHTNILILIWVVTGVQPIQRRSKKQ